MFLDGLILAIPTYAIQIPMMMSAGRRAALAPPPAPGAFPFAPGTCGTMLLSWLVVLTIQGTYFTWMIGARGQTIGGEEPVEIARSRSVESELHRRMSERRDDPGFEIDL